MAKQLFLFFFFSFFLLLACKNDPIRNDRPKSKTEMQEQNNYFKELQATTGITAEQQEKLAKIWRKYENQRNQELTSGNELAGEKVKLFNEMQRLESIEAVGEEMYNQKLRFDSLWHSKQGTN